MNCEHWQLQPANHHHHHFKCNTFQFVMKYVTIAQNYIANSRYTIYVPVFHKHNTAVSLSHTFSAVPLSFYPSQTINTLIAFLFFSHARGGAAITIHSNGYIYTYVCVCVCNFYLVYNCINRTRTTST